MGVTQIGIAAPVTATVMLLFTVATVTFTLLNVLAFEGAELIERIDRSAHRLRGNISAGAVDCEFGRLR